MRTGRFVVPRRGIGCPELLRETHVGVSASADDTARIWDVATGATVMTLRGHENDVAFAAFSPDGRRIVTASWDSTARIWDVANLVKGDGFQIACQRLGNNISLDEIEKRYGLGQFVAIWGDNTPLPVDPSALD